MCKPLYIVCSQFNDFIVGKSETYQHYTIYCGIQANTPQYIVVFSKEFS